VTYEAYRELDIRTKLHTFCDWNPVSAFWYHDENLRSHPENTYIHSTFMDCLDFLPEAIAQDIEANKERDPNWYNIYGLGLLGKIEGLVYPRFELCDYLPQQGTLIYGIDFGYSNDPRLLSRTSSETGCCFRRNCCTRRD